MLSGSAAIASRAISLVPCTAPGPLSWHPVRSRTARAAVGKAIFLIRFKAMTHSSAAHGINRAVTHDTPVRQSEIMRPGMDLLIVEVDDLAQLREFVIGPGDIIRPGFEVRQLPLIEIGRAHV